MSSCAIGAHLSGTTLSMLVGALNKEVAKARFGKVNLYTTNLASLIFVFAIFFPFNLLQQNSCSKSIVIENNIQILSILNEEVVKVI